MIEIQRCPQCGAELPAGAGDQPCSACLIKLGLESWTGQAAGNQSSPTQPYSARPEAPTVEELAPRFPQFELLSLVGIGGMGAVYKALQKSLDRIVAVKIINREAASQPGFSERFAREARAMARLNHPHIVTIHDFGSVPAVTPADESTSVGDQPRYFLVMEYVEGVNLRELLRQKRLTPQQALAIVPPICDALQFAHDEGIVHRDIKPENILIDQKDRVKIADFGLAKLIGRSPRDVTLTEANHAMGTAHYMAPEQLERPLEVDHRADIYALGVTFYEMLTGELPIGRFAPPSQKVQIDVRLDDIVLRTLEKQPERRYQQASEVKTAVESCRHQVKVNPAAGNPPTGMLVYAPGAAPRMLVLTLGFITSMLLAAVGVGVLAYAATNFAPNDERWSGYLGGGLGPLIGGIAGMVGCWNQLRMLRGKRDLWQEPHWNWLDTVMFTYGLLGAVCLAAAAIWWSSLDIWQRYVALLVGSLGLLQGGGFSLWRLALRRAAAGKLAQPAPDPRMVLVAVGMLVCGLMAFAGIIVLVYSVTTLPLGSGKFWGGIGAATGFFFGGGGGLIGTWNSYRSLEGLPDWMTESKRNMLDHWMIVAASSGGLLMLAGVIAAPWVTGTSVYALELLGGILVLQGGTFLAIRALMRRAARQEAEHRPDA